jgi:hypothetical protein
MLTENIPLISVVNPPAEILKRLKCKSFAEAVNKYDLMNHKDPWKELERLAVNEQQLTRMLGRITRHYRNLSKQIS